MKKLSIISLVIMIIFFTAGCRSEGLSDINTSVKAITKCCTKITLVNAKVAGSFIKKEEVRIEENIKASTLLPVYTWDSKQMFW